MLDHYDISVSGKHAVIVGRSNIVGKHLGIMLLNRDATVSICHSKTPDLPAMTKKADILVSAVGQPKMITADMVKEGAVVLDVILWVEPLGLLSEPLMIDFSAEYFYLDRYFPYLLIVYGEMLCVPILSASVRGRRNSSRPAGDH